MAKKTNPVAELLAAFRALPARQQAEFMGQLRGKELLLHPGVKRMQENEQYLVKRDNSREIREGIFEICLEFEKTKVIRNPGLPTLRQGEKITFTIWYWRFLRKVR